MSSSSLALGGWSIEVTWFIESELKALHLACHQTHAMIPFLEVGLIAFRTCLVFHLHILGKRLWKSGVMGAWVPGKRESSDSSGNKHTV
jgi:hypothetical protein